MSRHLEAVGDGAHGDERVSAYLDGELDSGEYASFEAEFQSSPDLAAEVAAIGSTREALRGLPDVAPRRDLVELGPSAEPSRRGWVAGGVGAVVAIAAVWLLVALVVFSGGGAAVVPAFDDLVGQHESASALETTADFEPMERDEVDMAMKAPDDIAGMEMGGVYQSEEVVQVVYTDGVHNVSVFHQSGEVAWDDMPPGDMMTMDGNQAWHSTMHGSDVVVVDSEDGIVTIVADGDMATDVAEVLTA